MPVNLLLFHQNVPSVGIISPKYICFYFWNHSLWLVFTTITFQKSSPIISRLNLITINVWTCCKLQNDFIAIFLQFCLPSIVFKLWCAPYIMIIQDNFLELYFRNNFSDYKLITVTFVMRFPLFLAVRVL